MADLGELAITAERLEDLAQRVAPDFSGVTDEHLVEELRRLAGIFTSNHRNHALIVEAANRLRAKRLRCG